MVGALMRPAMAPHARLAAPRLTLASPWTSLDRADKTETPPASSSSRTRSEGAVSHHLVVESAR
jgi:hypothetical protein